MATRNPKIFYVVVGLEVRAPSEDMKVAERVDSLIGKKPEYDSLAFNNRRDQSKSEKTLKFLLLFPPSRYNDIPIIVTNKLFEKELFLFPSLSLSLEVLSSVTRLGEFSKFLVTNLLLKVAEIFDDCLG